MSPGRSATARTTRSATARGSSWGRPRHAQGRPLAKFYQDDAAGNTAVEPAGVLRVHARSGTGRHHRHRRRCFDADNAGDDLHDNKALPSLNLSGTERTTERGGQARSSTRLIPDRQAAMLPSTTSTTTTGAIPRRSTPSWPRGGSPPFDWDVDIGVLDLNDWPELDGVSELGDGVRRRSGRPQVVDPGHRSSSPGPTPCPTGQRRPDRLVWPNGGLPGRDETPIRTAPTARATT